MPNAKMHRLKKIVKTSRALIKAVHPTICTTNTICKLNFLPNAPIKGAAKKTRTDAAKYTIDPNNDIENTTTKEI